MPFTRSPLGRLAKACLPRFFLNIFLFKELVNMSEDQVETEEYEELSEEQPKQVEDEPPDPVRILAFDVGILTLSFTLLEYNYNSPPKIVLWRMLNLLDPQDDGCVHDCNIEGCGNQAVRGQTHCIKHVGGKLCIYEYSRGVKVGQKCGAKVYLNTDHCKAHLPDEQEDINAVCQYIYLKGDKKMKMCGHKCVNAKYCTAHVKVANSARYKKMAQKLKKRPPHVSDTNLAAILAKRLDEFPELLTATRVLIENQPKINGRMKKFSYWLHMYFVIRGIVDRQHFERVIFLSAKHKLRLRPPGLNLEWNGGYDNRKENAIKICRHMISNSKRSTEYFDSLRKKDDLSDSFLMCYWYLKTYYMGRNE